jgi:hypothetical protein
LKLLPVRTGSDDRCATSIIDEGRLSRVSATPTS